MIAAIEHVLNLGTRICRGTNAAQISCPKASVGTGRRTIPTLELAGFGRFGAGLVDIAHPDQATQRFRGRD